MSSHTSFSHQVKRIAKSIITPSPLPDTAEERQRAQVLLICIVIAFVIVSITFIIRYSLGEPYIPTRVAPFAVIAIYIISRWRFYQIGIYIGVLVATLLNPILIFIFPETINPLATLTTASLAILLANLLAPKRHLIGVIVLNVSLFTVIVALLPDTTLTGRVTWIIPIIIVSFFALIQKYVLVEVVGQSATQSTQNLNSFHPILNTLPDALILHSDTGPIIYANPRAVKLLGYKDSSELVGLPFTQFVKKGQSSNLRYDTEHGMTSMRYHDTLYPQQDAPFNAEVITSPFVLAGELTTSIIIRTGQAIATATDELLRLKAIFNYVEDAIFVATVTTDNEIQIRSVNPAHSKLTGYDAGEMLGRKPLILRSLEDDVLDTLYSQLAEGVSQQGENLIYRRDKQPLTVEWALHPLTVDDKVKYIVGILRDVTLQRVIELDLHQKQERFTMMSELMSDYAYVLDIQPDNKLQFQWMTGSYAQVFGRSYEELITYAGWEALVHPDERPLYQLHYANLMQGQAGVIEYRIVRPDGAIRWVSDNTRPIKDEKGQTIAIYGAAHDITERVLADEALRLDAFQKAVIAELGLLALKTDNPEALLQDTLVLCQSVLDMSFSMVVANEQNNLQIIATSGEYDELQVGQILPIDSQLSLVGYTLTSREFVVGTNFSEETRFSPLPAIEAAAMQAGIGVVIQGASTIPYGILALYSKSERDFSDSDVIFLQSVANVVGTFIERLRAQQAEKEEREFAEGLREATIAINAQRDLDILLKQILETLARLVPHQNSSTILLWDDDNKCYRFVSVRGHLPEDEADLRAAHIIPEDSPIFTMILAENAVVIADAQAHPGLFSTRRGKVIRSYIGVNIQVGGRTIGFITMANEEPNVFSEHDAERVQAFAEKVGNAILNARHAEDLQQMVQEQTAELQREREQLQTILDATGEGIFYTEDGRMLYANRTMAEMTGYELEDFIGASTNILHPLDIDAEELELLRTSGDYVKRGETWREVVRLKRKDDSVFPAGLTISRVGQGIEAMRRAVTVVRDTSTEQEIAQFRSRFIADAAHELRSPITNLNTSMYLIGKQPDKTDEHLGRLRRVIERMNHLVRDLLDTFSFEQGRIKLKKEVLILQEVIRDVVDLQSAEAANKSIALINQMPDEPLQLLADAHRLEQVFTNLINNAINHTPKNGQICLYCTATITENQVTIVVEDNGKGIANDDLKHIFQPFFRVDGQKPETGTGLGLSIAYDIVTLHGGTIWVESELNVGTKFFVALPVLEN